MEKQLSDYEYFSEHDREHSLADYKVFYENLISYNKALNSLSFEIEQCIEKKKTLPDVEMTKLGKWIENHPNIPARSPDNFYSPDNERSLLDLVRIVNRDERFKQHTWNKFHLPPTYNDEPDDYLDALHKALKEYVTNVTTKSQLDSLLKVVKTLEMLNTGIYLFGIFSSYEEYQKKHLEILGISKDDLWLGHFDLKNTEDIKHCKKLYPLAKEYPDLFHGWYDSDDIIQFEPTYSNGLEKKRKEINAKLADKKAKTTNGFKRGAIKAAMKVVPEKLGKKASKLEQKIADIAYNKKQAGRK